MTTFLRTLRNVGIAVIVMLLLVVLAGAAYLLFFSLHHIPTNISSTTASSQRSPFTATPPAVNAKEGVAIQAIAPSASRGSTLVVVATTNAGSRCTVTPDKGTTGARLTSQTADAYGTVEWDIPVSTVASAGRKSLTITCSYYGRTGVAVGAYRITR